MRKKPKKHPEELPFDKFFGGWAGEVRDAQAAEKSTRRTAADSAPRLTLLQNLLKDPSKGNEPSPPRLICLYESSPEFWDEVENWWPFRLLRGAAKNGDSEGYKRLLSYFLLRLGVAPPKGVLIPFRWPRGRPNETEMIYVAWESMGRPTLVWRTLDELAKTFYADDFGRARSDAKLRKNLRDRVRGTILRYQSTTATKSASIP